MKLTNIANKNLFVLANIVAYLERYAAESASEVYVYGFAYDNDVYFIDWNDIKEITFETSYNSDTFQPTVRIRGGKKEHKKMVESGKATKLCTVADFEKFQSENDYRTKGQTFEGLIWKWFGVEGYKPDSRDFRTTSDIEGLKMQIKYERGTFDLGKSYDYSFLKVVD